LALTTTYNLAASAGVGGFGVEDAIRDYMCISKEDGLGKDHEAIMKHVESNVIGKDLVYESPFGKRSGMSLRIMGVFMLFVREVLRIRIFRLLYCIKQQYEVIPACDFRISFLV